MSYAVLETWVLGMLMDVTHLKFCIFFDLLHLLLVAPPVLSFSRSITAARIIRALRRWLVDALSQLLEGCL